MTYFPGEAEMRAFHEENRDLNFFDDELEGGNSDLPRSDGDSEQGRDSKAGW